MSSSCGPPDWNFGDLLQVLLDLCYFLAGIIKGLLGEVNHFPGCSRACTGLIQALGSQGTFFCIPWVYNEGGDARNG